MFDLNWSQLLSVTPILWNRHSLRFHFSVVQWTPLVLFNFPAHSFLSPCLKLARTKAQRKTECAGKQSNIRSFGRRWGRKQKYFLLRRQRKSFSKKSKCLSTGSNICEYTNLALFPLNEGAKPLPKRKIAFECFSIQPVRKIKAKQKFHEFRILEWKPPHTSANTYYTYM